MKTIVIPVPAMYGDHHVVEARRLLLELPGVHEVYASSAFHIVEVHYDTEKTGPDALRELLASHGYLDELPMPAETGVAAHLQTDPGKTFFRHTEVYESLRNTVSFSQQVTNSGKPLWNCPGFGVIKNKMEE